MNIKIHGNYLNGGQFAYLSSCSSDDTKHRNQNKHLTHTHSEWERRRKWSERIWIIVVLIFFSSSIPLSSSSAVGCRRRHRRPHRSKRKGTGISEWCILYCLYRLCCVLCRFLIPVAFAPNDWIIVRVVHVICGGFPFFPETVIPICSWCLFSGGCYCCHRHRRRCSRCHHIVYRSCIYKILTQNIYPVHVQLCYRYVCIVSSSALS